MQLFLRKQRKEEMLVQLINVQGSDSWLNIYFCLRCIPFGGIHLQGSDFSKKWDVDLTKKRMSLNPGCQVAHGGDKRHDPNWLGYCL